MSSPSRYIEIRPDNIPANGKISFKNGFPVLSFSISAQNGMLDPRSIRIVGEFAAFKNNLATPTPLTNGDNVTMNNRLGIFNLIDTLTIRSSRSKMICESIPDQHFLRPFTLWLRSVWKSCWSTPRCFRWYSDWNVTPAGLQCSLQSRRF